MFGISGLEFLVIVIVAIAVIPAKNWPGVARFIANTIRYFKNVISKIQDNVDELQNEITKDLPIDSLSQKTMDDMVATFASPVKKTTAKGVRKKKK